jgi:4-amino-4-deoxy-L-arabinose transferase-like glycosyltransferase
MSPVARQWAVRLGAVAGVALLLGVMVVHLGAMVALIAPATVGVLLLVALVRGIIDWPDEAACRRILWWTLVAFGAHLLFGLAATNISRGIRYYLGTDSLGYDAIARAMVEHWTDGLPFPRVPGGKEGFYYMLATLYWVFGFHTAAGLAINAALAAGMVPVMSDVTRRLFGPAAARYAAPLVVLLPGLFLWTSQLMRESGMLFLLAVALNCAVRLTEQVTLPRLATFTATLVLAFTFRAPVALIVAAGLIVGIMIGHNQLVSGLGTALASLAVVVAVMLGSGLGYSGYQTAVNVNLTQANIVRRDLAFSAETGYAAEVDISTTRGALSFLPVGVVSFVLGPFPWNIRSARQLPFVPDMVAWWLLLPSLWAGWRTARRVIGRRTMLIVFPSAGIICFMGLALGNFGTVVRERLQLVILVVPLISLGLAQRAARRQGRDADTSAVPDDAARASVAADV